MPKIDPMTGCKVMTLGEYAEADGTTIGSILSEIYEDFAEDEERWAQSYLSNMLNVLGCEVLRARKENPEHDYPEPVEIIEKEITKVYEGLFDSELAGWAIARAADGETYLYKFSDYHSRGSMWEPPEDEFYLEVEP